MGKYSTQHYREEIGAEACLLAALSGETMQTDRHTDLKANGRQEGTKYLKKGRHRADSNRR